MSDKLARFSARRLKGHITIARLRLASSCRRMALEFALGWTRRSEEEVSCPFCRAHSTHVKVNGDGWYRCKGDCRRSFFLSFEPGRGEAK